MCELHTDRGYAVTVKSEVPKHKVIEHQEDVGAHPRGEICCGGVKHTHTVQIHRLDGTVSSPFLAFIDVL